jgi:hypothetical protein
MFYLVRLDRDGSGNLVETPLPDYGTFEKGADAAKASKTAAGSLGGAKVQCRRIAQAGDWRAAMAKRFETGELLPLPSKWDLAPIADHFAHISAQDSNLIGYLDTEEHGIIYKVTVLTAGRYISRFYPSVGDDKRRHLIAAIDPTGEIYYAWDADDIEEVYRDGPSSCMDGEHSFDHLPVWPTQPYGAGDLAVAYTKNKDGDIQSRAVCWPEKKLFGRIYGDFQRMKAAFEAEGYISMRDDNTVHGNKKQQTFVGAKLLKIPTGQDHEYVMPYFDDIKVAIDMGDHFVIAEQGELGRKWVSSGGSDTGLALLQTLCPRRNVATKVRDMRFVHGVNEEWSQDAIRSETFVCGGNGKLYPHEFKVIMGHDVPWSKEHFEQNGEHCTVTHKDWPKDQMVQLGDKRVHCSVEHRFDKNGEELQIIEPKTKGRRKSSFEALPAEPSDLIDAVRFSISEAIDPRETRRMYEPEWVLPSGILPSGHAPFVGLDRASDRVTATDIVLTRSRRVA